MFHPKYIFLFIHFVLLKATQTHCLFCTSNIVKGAWSPVCGSEHKRKHQTETAIRFTSLCKQSCLTSRGHRELECTAAYCNCRRADDSFNLVWSKVTWSELMGKAFQWIVFSSKPYPLPRLVPGSRCPKAVCTAELKIARSE